jgi:hypothetical protein
MTQETIPAARIAQSIYLLRGQKVMLDSHLAQLYGVTTGNLNKTVMRNRDRFPADFMFRLNADEAERLIFQIGISKDRGGRRHLPYAFTEQVREKTPHFGLVGSARCAGICLAPRARSHSSLGHRPRISGTSNPSALKARFIAVLAKYEIRPGTFGVLNRAFSARLLSGTTPGALPQAEMKRAVGAKQLRCADRTPQRGVPTSRNHRHD